MANPTTQLYNVSRLASSAAVISVPGRIVAVQIVGVTNDCLVEYTNDATGNGTNLLSVGSSAESASQFVDLTRLGGIVFTSKIYAAITGTCEVYTWYD